MTQQEMIMFNSQERSEKWKQYENFLCGYYYKKVTKLTRGNESIETILSMDNEASIKTFFEPKNGKEMIWFTNGLKEDEIEYANEMRKKYHLKELVILGEGKDGVFHRFYTFKARNEWERKEYSEYKPQFNYKMEPFIKIK